MERILWSTAEVRYLWKTFPPAFWGVFYSKAAAFTQIGFAERTLPLPLTPPPACPPCHTCHPTPPPTPTCMSWWHNVPAWSSSHLLQGFRDFTSWVLFSIVLNGLSAEIYLGPVFGSTNSLSAAVQFFFLFAWVIVLCIIYTLQIVLQYLLKVAPTWSTIWCRGYIHDLLFDVKVPFLVYYLM